MTTFHLAWQPDQGLYTQGLLSISIVVNYGIFWSKFAPRLHSENIFDGPGVPFYNLTVAMDLECLEVDDFTNGKKCIWMVLGRVYDVIGEKLPQSLCMA
jgi:hypothetical protein